MRMASNKNGELGRTQISCRMDPYRLKELLICESGRDSMGRTDSIGKKLDRASWVFTRFRVGVILIRCRLNNRFYIGLFDVRDMNREGFDFKILEKYDPQLSLDVKTYGLGEFEIRVLGFFSNIEEAIDYRDYSVNKRLDLGMNYYGIDVIDGVIPRFLLLKLPLKVLSKMVKIALFKKVSLNSLVLHLISRFLRNIGQKRQD